jgi:hypothetical protein
LPRNKGTFFGLASFVVGPGAGRRAGAITWRRPMHGIIYLIGLIVVIMAILSFLGLR